MSKAEAEAVDTAGGVSHKAQQSPVPDAGSRPRFRLSLVATGPYIARTVSAQEREAAAAAVVAVVGIAGIAVSRSVPAA